MIFNGNANGATGGLTSYSIPGLGLQTSGGATNAPAAAKPIDVVALGPSFVTLSTTPGGAWVSKFNAALNPYDSAVQIPIDSSGTEPLALALGKGRLLVFGIGPSSIDVATVSCGP